MCERELETEQRLQHTDLPSSSGHSSESFSFSCGSTGGLDAQLSAESLFSLLYLEHSSSSELQLLNRGSRGPPLLGAVLSTAPYLQLTRTSCASSYIIVLCPLSSTHQQLRFFTDILDRMHLLFTQVYFLFWQLGRVGGQNATQLIANQFSISEQS